MTESPQSQALVAISTLVDREGDANPEQPEAAYQLPVLGQHVPLRATLDHTVSLCKLEMLPPQDS